MPEISDEQLAEYERLRDDNAAKDLYGGPVAGGGTPGGGAPSKEEAWIADFQNRFDDPSQSFSVREVERYSRILGGAHLLHNLAEVSQIFRRHGITPQVVDQFEKGKLRQNRPAKAGVGLPPRG